MLLAIIFFNVWGVLQLVVLGSFARTVRVRTILAGIAVGLCFCAPFAAFLEYTLASVIAALMGRPVEAVLAVTTYTVDPLIEEIIWILPLTVLLLVPVIRRQLSVTDCVLIGAAAGAGFGLAEDLYRFGAAPQYATAIPGGWIAPFQSPVAAGGGRLFIPSVTTAIGSWLPDMGGAGLFGLSPNIGPNSLLIWSAIAGLAVGLWLRLDGRRRWYVAAALLVYVSGAHAAGNADIIARRELLLTAPFRALSSLEPLMPVAALALAWWVDRRRQSVVIPEHLLAAERSASPRALGTLRASLARMPESIVWVDRLVRLRRTYNNERYLGGHDAENLRPALDEVRDQIDQQLQQPGSWRAAALAWRGDALRALRQLRTILWIVLALPSVLWFVVGGWPATAGAQRLLTEGVGWGLVVGLTVAAQVWVAWRMLSLVQASRLMVRMPISDPGVSVLLRVMGAMGALGFAAFGLLRASASSTPGIAHAIDAILSLSLGPLAALANLGPGLLNAFNTSPNDLRVPLPLSDSAYFTPTGIRQTVGNAFIDKLLDGLDPFRFRRFIEGFGGPRLDSGLKMKVGSGDPNDKSELVGNVFLLAAGFIFGRFGGCGGRAGFGRTAPSGGGTGAAPGVDQFARTQPAPPPPSHMAKSVQIPGPPSPLAETFDGARPPSPIAKPVPIPSPQPLPRTVDGPPPPSPLAGAPGRKLVPPGDGPYQGQTPAGEPREMGGIIDQANETANATYRAARDLGWTHGDARQFSYDTYLKRLEAELSKARIWNKP